MQSFHKAKAYVLHCSHARVTKTKQNGWFDFYALAGGRRMIGSLHGSGTNSLHGSGTNSLHGIYTDSLHGSGTNSLLVTPSKQQHSINHRRYSTEQRQVPISQFRNFAIIAHANVGKTTMMEQMLKTAQITNENPELMMDHLDLEKERMITIMSKQTRIQYQDYIFQVMDTPGHADFSAEVERVMDMVDGVLLLVDATDGVMTQTKYTLGKALEAKTLPIVLINKADRSSARPEEVLNEIFDLFVDLEASDEQLEFPVLYSSAKDGWAIRNPDDPRDQGIIPVFEEIIRHIPPPKIEEGVFRMLVSSVEYDKHFGRLVTGKIVSGSIKKGDLVKSLARDKDLREEGSIKQIVVRKGLEKLMVDEAFAGEIVSLSGLSITGITDTVGAIENDEIVDSIPLDPPILSIQFLTNDSPLNGKEGDKCSALQLRDRLKLEAQNNVSLHIQPTEGGEGVLVKGRGELQLGILMENLRREGYEFQVSRPKVLYRLDEDQSILEPIEEVIIDLNKELMSRVMEMMTDRKGEMLSHQDMGQGQCRLEFEVPTRCFIGFPSEFRLISGGSGSLNHRLKTYKPYSEPMEKIGKGALISNSTGKATSYAIRNFESRGTVLIKPGDKIYEGMVVGEHSKPEDAIVNPTKEKQLSNVRSKVREEIIKLKAPRVYTVEEALFKLKEDELLEVTPENLRIRKKFLIEHDRKKQSKLGELNEIRKSLGLE